MLEQVKCVFYQLSKVYELVFSAPVLPEGGLFLWRPSHWFPGPTRALVDHALEGLAETAEQADGSVAGPFLGVLFLSPGQG